MMIRWSIVVVLGLVATKVHAGGSGPNVVVIVNQSSSDSVQLGNYYCERRQVPPQNVLRVNWTGGKVEWSKSDFETYLLNPLISMLATRSLTNQVDYIVLSTDIPYRVTTATNGANSTTSTLFYGFKPDSRNLNSCPLAPGSTNFYAGSESIFRSTPPGDANSNSWLVTMITSSNLAQAKTIVDRGVASDGTFPTQTVILGKSSDVARNVRYLTFDNAIFDARLLGNLSVLRTNLDSPYGFTNLLAYQNGHYQFSILTNAFVPGAMADSLTSFGGRILEPNDHTTLLALLNAGASGSFGTVVEPCNYLEKFPSAQIYFYQARGFNLAECFYQSVTNPYQGLLVGEPLAAPFAQPPTGSWSNLPLDALLSGTTNLFLQFTASDANHPVQQVDLFLDGTLAQTLTNIAPRQDNILYVTINGQPTNYTVPAGATIKSLASDLTALLNTPSYANATKVSAFAHGDRVQLQSFDSHKPGEQIPVTVSNSNGSASALTTLIAASRTNFLDTLAYGIRSCLVTNGPLVGDYLQLTVTKTNGNVTTLSVTNDSATGTNVSQLTQMLINLVNAHTDLLAADGLAAEDFVGYNPAFRLAEFNLRARTLGWPAAQIQVRLTGSLTFVIKPSGTNKLDENLIDLQPRNHLYVTAGVTNLAFSFPFDTTSCADGYHELAAVVYEGSHVRTQRRVAQNVRIRNTPLAASFNTLVGDTNSAVETTLQFSVVANTNNVTRIELFSTGGLLATVSNQSSVTFNVAGTNLDLGLHPFYAIVTGVDARQYRTETKWIRLVGRGVPFPLEASFSPFKLTWPAAAGRRYDILTITNLTDAFHVCDTVTPTNSIGIWTETNGLAPEHFYRVGVSP